MPAAIFNFGALLVCCESVRGCTFATMESGAERDFEAMAALFGDIAADVPEEAEGEEQDEAVVIDIAACLSALRQGVHDEASPVQLHPPEEEEEEPQFDNPRARNAWLARRALARKRMKLNESTTTTVARHAVASSASSAMVQTQPSLGAPHVRVPTGVLDAIRVGVMAAFGNPHLQAALHACLRFAHAQGTPRDEVVDKLVQFCCVESEGQVQTKLAVASKLGVDQGKIDRLMPAICSCLVNMEQLVQRQAEIAMSGAASAKLVFVDANRYDETPMETTTTDVTHAIVARPVTKETQRRGKSSACPSVRRLVLGTDTGASKLFQTEAAYGMLCKVGAPGSGNAKLVGIIGRPVTWIQQVEQNSAEVYKVALQRVCAPTEASSSYDLPVRLATSDKNAPNVKAEKSLVRDRSDHSKDPPPAPKACLIVDPKSRIVDTPCLFC